jgi:hypothetical protein
MKNIDDLQTGIHSKDIWIPAFAGMTCGEPVTEIGHM